jgi:hypothetical protein
LGAKILEFFEENAFGVFLDPYYLSLEVSSISKIRVPIILLLISKILII